MTASAVLDLTPGRSVVLNDAEWLIEAAQPHLGQVALSRCSDHTQMRVSIRALVNHPGCRQPEVAMAGSVSARQPASLKDLPPDKQKLARLRFAHLMMEVQTGFRGGDPLRPAPGEPRPAYDPAVTTLTGRRLAKVAELRALAAAEPEHAQLLGLDRVSLRTLERMAERWARFGMVGCADGRWLREYSGPRTVTEPVREAIFAVRAETLHRSTMTMAARARLICQYVREVYGPDVHVPCYQTLRKTWRAWFGSGRSRARYARSAAVAEANATGVHVVVHRPGQVVALDTTELPVKLRDGVFSDPVTAYMTLALDVYTHSLVAFRLTLVSDTSVDVAMLLRDVMSPLPMRPGWGEELAWPYPGIPATVVAELAGQEVAGLPFFAPETVTTDHGNVYKNHHLVEVQRLLGVNVRPARVLRPTDKQAVERAFGGIRSLLFEHLLGYAGVDVADRGADPMADAVLTLSAMENLIARWIVGIWQNRRFGEYAPCWDPGGDHSPNTLFATAMAQGGFGLQIPRPELFYQLLPSHRVRIHGRRGVKVRGLYYSDDAAGTDPLGPYRAGPSTRGGVSKGSWVVHSDPRDVRTVFFQDPADHEIWHELRWSGLPPAGQIPPFDDARVEELQEEAKKRGLTPKSDAELLPLLLDLIGAEIPVERWPTQMSKKQRVQVAREQARGQSAEADRPLTHSNHVDATGTAATEPALADRAHALQTSIDQQRRQRREAADLDPRLPRGLGAAARARSLLSLPDNEPEHDQERP